jgi:hypothetical protein
VLKQPLQASHLVSTPVAAKAHKNKSSCKTRTQFSYLAANKGYEFIFIQACGDVGAIKHFCRKITLASMQIKDLFFNRILYNETINGGGTALSDPMRKVGGLVFDSRIPPRIEVDDVIGGSEIETGAPGLEADQEEVALPALKGLDPLRAIFAEQIRRDSDSDTITIVSIE